MNSERPFCRHIYIYMNTRFNQKEYSSIIRLEEESGALGKRLAEKSKLLLLDDSFVVFTKNIRERLGIPANGFNRHNKNQWRKSRIFLKSGYLAEHSINVKSNEFKESFDEVERFFERRNFKILIKDFPGLFEGSFYKFIRAYILFGEFLIQAIDIGVVDTSFIKKVDEDDIWRAVRLEFSPYATKEEVITFIKKKWAEIEGIQKYIIGTRESKKRNKVKKNFFRDVFIFNKFEEYRLLNDKYPDQKAASFMKKEFDVQLSDGTIRSIVSRIRNFVANKKH